MAGLGLLQKYLLSSLLRPFRGGKAREEREEWGQRSDGGRNEKKMNEGKLLMLF